jgi:hypothetical protein
VYRTYLENIQILYKSKNKKIFRFRRIRQIKKYSDFGGMVSILDQSFADQPYMQTQ